LFQTITPTARAALIFLQNLQGGRRPECKKLPTLSRGLGEFRSNVVARRVHWASHTVPVSSSPLVAGSEALVALSLFRLGFDTRAARALKDACPSGAPPAQVDRQTVDAVLAAVEVPPWERSARMGAARVAAREAIEAGLSAGLTILTVGEPTYPRLLRQIPDPPIVLWCRGRPELLDCPSVAIVGSRRASPAGLVMAKHLGREVSRAGLVVTSGLARGIDGASHRGALESGGLTIGVLGNGVDVAYPAEHRDLTAAIAATGLLVSEFPPGVRPYPSHFPLRNRIISGLSRAVVVVEANERSGSLITARAALEQGRDVLAVPGPVAPGNHRGCHGLIKDGARVVESVEDILEELRWVRPAPSSPNRDEKSLLVSDLDVVIKRGEVLTLDDLAARSGRPVPELLAELGRLEVAGRIARMAGGTFARLD
jgi:DNA processing protein